MTTFRRQRHAFAGRPLAAVFLLAVAGSCLPAQAGEDRSLSFFHTHTGETATIIFRRNGVFDEHALEQLNWLLRDWRVGEPTKMDPQVFDVLWELYRSVGSREPIHVISAYRSPATNGVLRQASSGVAEHSQHMSGKAIDIRLPDVDTARLREAAMRLQYGGVGYYPGSNFVHVDTGSVRAWPRMSQDQLTRLFPDGKTVHLPPSGKPLAGYEEARAELLQRQGSTAVAAVSGNAVGRFFAGLMGREEPATAAARPLPAEAAAKPVLARAYAPLPPRRPAESGAPASGSPAFAEVAQAETDAAAFVDVRVLFRPLATRYRLPSRVQVTVLRVRPQPVPREATDFRPAPLQVGFSAQAKPVLEVARFTGPAVQRLPVSTLASAEH